MEKNSKIYVAGHRGMVGSAIVRELWRQGYTNIITRTHKELDLTRQDQVEAFFEAEKPEYVFLAAAKVGARVALVERDVRIGGTTVQAEVVDMGLIYAWRRPIIAGPGWEMVKEAVATAGGVLPDFSKQEPDQWMASCVHVDPDIYSRVAEETLLKAGVDLLMGVEVTSLERKKQGWNVGPVTGRQVVDATGNATVAALAGAGRVQAPEEIRQPGSFFFWLSSEGLDFDWAAVNKAYQEAVSRGELLPTDVHVGMSWFIHKGGGSGCYVPQADNSTPEARAETNQRGREARDRTGSRPEAGAIPLTSSATASS